jgi:hypothetical protein
VSSFPTVGRHLIPYIRYLGNAGFVNLKFKDLSFTVQKQDFSFDNSRAIVYKCKMDLHRYLIFIRRYGTGTCASVAERQRFNDDSDPDHSIKVDQVKNSYT